MMERVGPSTGSAAAIGATSVEARSPAPDVARGAMLLLIALANIHLYLYGHDIGVRGYPVTAAVPDQVVALLQMTFVDGRAYPMFAALFGYGIVQLGRRQAHGGLDQDAVRKLIRRRGWWLLLFGSAHAVLLFSGDIIGAYGLLAVVLAGVLVRARDRTLLLTAGVWMLPAGVFGALQGFPPPAGSQSLLPSMSIPDPLVAAGFRAVEWVALLLSQVLLSLIPPLLLGVWAARRRVLEDPQRYRRWLRLAAVLGLGLAAAGGLPMALMSATVWAEPSPTASMLAGLLHGLTGYAGGLGYAALAGLVVLRLGGRHGPLIGAVKACGQRSMTCYLAQSVVFVAVLAAYGGKLGDDVSVAGAALIAILTWMLTVVAAAVMQRRRYRGPAEILLRRLTYGRRHTKRDTSHAVS